jgi:uncharacterized protein
MTLFEAAQMGTLAQVVEALKTTKDVNELGANKSSPLIEAARRGELEMVKVLLAAGADADWKDAEQETALLKAGANGHGLVVEVLMPMAGDDEKETALAFLHAFGAAHGPQYSYDVSRLQKGAAQIAARAATFFGDENPQQRVDRAARANEKKK